MQMCYQISFSRITHHASRFTHHASLRSLNKLLSQIEHILYACSRIESNGRRRLNQMSNTDVAQPLRVFAYLIRGTGHRTAVAPARIFEQHGERSQYNFHVLSAGALRRLAELVYHRLEAFKVHDPSGVPSIAILRGAIKCVLAKTCDKNRRMRLLNRLWSHL